MNFKRFHESRNLMCESATTTYTGDLIVKTVANSSKVVLNKSTTSQAVSTSTDVNISLDAGTYTISVQGLNLFSDNFDRLFIRDSNNNIVVQDIRVDASKTFTISSTTIISKVIFVARANSEYNDTEVTLMLNTGSTPQPYEPYSSEVWHDTPHYIHNTSTDTLTTLPADIYANDTTATIGLKGDMEQSGTASPTTPIQPQECGDLETTGEHAGQYKIPILNNSQTTNVYLGDVESTRKIGKYIFTGDENITRSVSASNVRMYYVISSAAGASPLYCTHFVDYAQAAGYPPVGYCNFNNISNFIMGVDGTEFETADDFKTWLRTQYTNGNPLTVWYILANETTGIVNEPLRKIGNYADEVSGITIPTIAGANTISVDTTLQPSEVTVNYKGWHPVQSVHEYDSNYTIATMQALTIAQLQTHTISDLQGGVWS